MKDFPLPLPGLIHELLATVLCFSLSREKVDQVFSQNFQGEWKYLKKIAYERAETQATRAVLELALLLRILDDEGSYSKTEWKTIGSCGYLTNKDGSQEELSVRNSINKIIHARTYVWEKEYPNIQTGPILVCYGRDEEKWEKADIEILTLAAICGNFAT